MACGNITLFLENIRDDHRYPHNIQSVAEFQIYIATNTRCRRFVVVDGATDWVGHANEDGDGKIRP